MANAPSYFEHNERKRARVVEVDLVECDGMLVSERQITSEEFQALVRKHFGNSETPNRDVE